MPNVFYEKGFRFFYYSNEGNPREPMHIHVEKMGGGIAKFWIEPYVELDSSKKLSSEDLNKIEKIIHKRLEEIKDNWNEYFTD